MRRIISIALAVLMILSISTVGVFTVSAETGSDLPANAKPINDGDEFASMQAGGYYYLAADITVDYTYARAFSGTLDGQGHTVTTTVPLFNNLNGGTVMNLTIAGEIDESEDGGSYLGALANAAGDAVINNVHNTAKVTGAKKAQVGGLVGFCRGGDDIYIENCSNSGALNGQSVGGILASSDGDNTEIVNCRNSGEITCSNPGANNGMGGILATITDSESSFRIDNCINTGNVTGPRPGGIFGTTETTRSAVITDCVNTGNVVSPTNYGGGIACRIDSYTPMVFRNCVNTGDVTVLKSQVGGMVGYSGTNNNTDGSGVFYGCVNTGTISVMDQETTATWCDVGGMAGKLSGRAEFYNCVNLGDLKATGGLGGMIAHTGSSNAMSGHVVSGCYSAGDYYTTAAALTANSRTNTAAGLVGYGWGAVYVTNNIVTANIKTDYDLETTLDNTHVVGGLVGYSNNNGGIYQKNYFLGTLTAGENVTKVICLNSVSADITSRIGNMISYNYSAKTYPLYFSINQGLSGMSGIGANAADFTDEKIAATLNKAMGYEAFTAVTEEDDNELGLVGVMPTAVLSGDADPAAEALPVGTAEEFLAMASNGSYYLTADITLPSTYPGVFSGILDGKGYTLTVSNPVFNVLSSGTVSNLTIKGAIVSEGTAETRSMADYRGALANVGAGAIVTGVTNAASVTAYKEAGGIFGQMQGGKLINCVNSGDIYSNTSIGGLVGHAQHEPVEYIGCVNNGTLNQYNMNVGMVGGIVGRIDYTHSVLDSCVNDSRIAMTAAGCKVGGLVGYIYSPVITNEDAQTNPNDEKILSSTVLAIDCVNNGDITGYDQAGGIIAWAQAHMTVENCVNNGDITSMQNYAGGVVGRAGANWGNPDNIHYFTNCVNNGTVTTHRQYVGGIVAYSQDNVTFEGCVNNGAVTGEDINYGGKCNAYQDVNGNTMKCHSGGSWRFICAGGILGRNNYDAKFYNCVNTGAISGNHKVGGIAGEIGVAVSKGIDGAHEFVGCVNTGSVYNTNVHTTTNVEHTNGTGGIFGTAFNANATTITVENCVVTGTVEGVINATVGVRSVAGFGGFVNTANAFFKNNYFAGVLSDGGSNLGVCSLLTYTNVVTIKRANFENNFTVSDITTYYSDRGGVKLLGSDYEYYVNLPDVASGKLCYLINEAAGDDIYFQQLGEDAAPTPIEGETPYMVRYDKVLNEYYNITDPSQERPDPDESTEPIETDPIEPEDSETDPADTDPIDPVTSETEPKVTDPIDPETSETEPEDTDPIDPETSETESVETDPVVTDPPATTDDGGCGSVVGASIALAALALIAPAGIMLKKRDEE